MRGVMRHYSVAVSLLAAVLAAPAAHAADTVLLGRAVEQREVPGGDDGCGELTADTICLGHPWFRWTLAVDRILSGPQLSGRVLSVRRQHTWVVRSYQRSYRLFVVRPIEDPSERRRLGADYYLLDQSEAHYCISFDPKELGLDVPSIVEEHDDGGTYCFALH
jgi:hypothetical protein